jgi:hypothetical protein
MRNRIFVVLAACAVLVGGSAVVLSQASQAGTGTAVLCARTGDRALAVFDGTCPTGYFKATLPGGGSYGVTAPIAGPQGVAGPAGAAGPQGPKGDPGTTVLPAVHKVTHLNNLTPANTTVTLTGVAAYKPGVDLLSGNSAADCPAGVNVTVAPNATATGSTQRTFAVHVSGFGPTEVCDLDIYQLSLTP